MFGLCEILLTPFEDFTLSTGVRFDILFIEECKILPISLVIFKLSSRSDKEALVKLSLFVVTLTKNCWH